jgi:hypothetical protein
MHRVVLALFLYKIFQSYQIFTTDMLPDFVLHLQNRDDYRNRKFNHSSDFYPMLTQWEKNNILHQLLIQ